MLKATYFETGSEPYTPPWSAPTTPFQALKNTEGIVVGDTVKIIKDIKLYHNRQGEIGQVMLLTSYDCCVKLPRLDGSGVAELLYYAFQNVRKIPPNETV